MLAAAVVMPSTRTSPSNSLTYLQGIAGDKGVHDMPAAVRAEI